MVWIGGLAYQAHVLLPAARRGAVAPFADAARRARPVTWTAIAVVVLSGFYNVTQLGDLARVMESGAGLMLAAKFTLVILAVALSSQRDFAQVTLLNAAVTTESTIYRRDINLGIAVALDWGPIVPVIKHADELSLLGIARVINDLGERARNKKLSPDEVQKGTFTITNPGVFGSKIGTPIINQPQVGNLCVGAIEKQPAVVTIDGNDSIAIRLKGMLSLAFDHRVVDGSDADKFMSDVKSMLQAFPESAV